MPYYKSKLARIHREAFGDYADLVAPGGPIPSAWSSWGVARGP